jgi:hypothetical protein
MSPITAAFRGVTKAADATTAAAGALGGAAISGIVGGLQGAATGVRTGLASGSHSSAAAALTLGAIGAAGLIEWPLLVTVGGAALVVHQLNRRAGDNEVSPSDTKSASATGATGPVKAAPQPVKTTARKATKATRKPVSAPAKSTASRRTSSK